MYICSIKETKLVHLKNQSHEKEFFNFRHAAFCCFLCLWQAKGNSNGRGREPPGSKSRWISRRPRGRNASAIPVGDCSVPRGGEKDIGHCLISFSCTFFCPRPLAGAFYFTSSKTDFISFLISLTATLISACELCRLSDL